MAPASLSEELLRQVQLCVDHSSPVGTTDDGRPLFEARGRFPFQLSIQAMPGALERAKPAARMEGDDGGDESDAADEMVRVRFIASSTSVDWYGTEMTKGMLESMARQMTRDGDDGGVPIIPRHGGFFDTVEWDEVMGRTVKATVRAADVENPADESERGYVLDVEGELFPDDEKTTKLVRRIKRGQTIGTSIGGWFTRITFAEDENGDIDRVYVEDGVLDHHAITRAPANPDAMGIEVLRDMLRGLLRPPTAEGVTLAQPAVEIVGAPDPSKRHIVSVEEDGDTIRLVFEREMEEEPDGGDDGGDGDRSTPTDGAGDSASALDERDSTGHTANEIEATADTGAPAGNEPPATRDEGTAGEATMDAELKALLQGINTGIDELRGRLDKVEARGESPAPATEPEPAPEPEPSPEVAALRSQVEQLQGQVHRLASQPAPRARFANPVNALDAEPKAARAKLVTGLENEGRTVLAAVTKRDTSIDTVLRFDRARPVDTESNPILSVRDGRATLRNLLHAAHQDGMLGADANRWN